VKITNYEAVLYSEMAIIQDNWDNIMQVKAKVRFSLEQAMKTQRGS